MTEARPLASSGKRRPAGTPLAPREVLRYLRLEEDPATAERLREDSLQYLGAFDTDAGRCHYWSYPARGGVAWAELRPPAALGMVEDVPPAVRAATPAHDAHPLRPAPRAQPLPPPPVAQRPKPPHAVWVPRAQMPAWHPHEAWVETAPFDDEVRRYGATVTKDASAGRGTRYFFLQLTSGRYACLASHPGFPQSVVVSLELDTRRAGKHSGGCVYVRDIEEILAPMGRTFTVPRTTLFIGWSTDA